MSSEGQQSTAIEERKQAAKGEKKSRARKVAPKALVLPPTLTVKLLADLTQLNPVDVIKQLMRNGIMAGMNQVIDYEMAALIASNFRIKVRPEEAAAPAVKPSADAIEMATSPDVAPPSELVVRPPVVTIMGHVDHGKTTLLDTIRNSRIAPSEAGSITQHIGAYQVKYMGKEITFLDTPGHEAFTAIRARGARVTDIAVVVVAADDGVMPQTVEAINHAKAADVHMVVAINKMDKPDVDPERVKRQLGEQALVLEEWGGDVITVPISATLGTGIDDLLENILAVAEVSEIRADPNKQASGVVIEAKLDKNRGPVATLLVQNGTLKIGDSLLAGAASGKVKAMANDWGKRIDEAAPSIPVEMLGFDSLPEAGDQFVVVPKEEARVLAEQRLRGKQAERSSFRTLTLEEMQAKVSSGEARELTLVVKADVQGSVEAVCSALERLEEGNAKVRILHAGSGIITENDVLLASASGAIILSFATSIQPGVERLAAREGVEIRNYDVIYRLIEDIQLALKGMLETITREVIQGHAEVRATFRIGGRTPIAGCMVSDGRITRGALIRVLRDGKVVHEGRISSLRHFKDEVTEMAAGFECGVGLGGFDGAQEGDVLESYTTERA